MSSPPSAARAGGPIPSPYVELGREAWARLRQNHPMSLDAQDITRVRGLGDRVDLLEVEDIYLPLSRLLHLYVEATHELHAATGAFLGEAPSRTPFIIGVAGSVAAGKSTTARILKELLSRWPHTPRVDLITTDGFLYPNKELERRGILHRKGFPESYDRRALTRFVAEVKAGREEVKAPLYSHLVYDIVPGEYTVVRQPDVLIVEGLNVLQPPQVRSDGRSTLAVSDFFDFSVYVDAPTADLRRWYIDRFLTLRETSFSNPDSYFRRYADLTDEQARATGAEIWAHINEPNLRQNIEPTRSRATLVLTKGGEHKVTRIRLRKV